MTYFDRILACIAGVAYAALVVCYATKAVTLASQRATYMIGFLLLFVGYTLLAVRQLSSAAAGESKDQQDRSSTWKGAEKVAYTSLAAFFVLGKFVPITPTVHTYDAFGAAGFALHAVGKYVANRILSIAAIASLLVYYILSGMHYYWHNDRPSRWGFFGARMAAAFYYGARLATGRVAI